MSASLLTIPQFVRAEPAIGSDQSGYQKARAGLLPVVRIGRRLFIDMDQWASYKRTGGRALPGGWKRQAPGA
jgi:hypothetical protein